VEGERSFSNYKRMHWVVCKTQHEKKRLRDFREKLREESGQQGGGISQGRLGTFPKENLCVSVLIFITFVGGRTVRIRTVYTTREIWNKFRGK
jgi:hypothetical protein